MSKSAKRKKLDSPVVVGCATAEQILGSFGAAVRPPKPGNEKRTIHDIRVRNCLAVSAAGTPE